MSNMWLAMCSVVGKGIASFKVLIFLPSRHARVGRGAIKVATSNGCWSLSFVDFRVIVSHYRENRGNGVSRCVSSRRLRWIVEKRTLVNAPTVVSSLDHYVYLFVFVLSDPCFKKHQWGWKVPNMIKKNAVYFISFSFFRKIEVI